MTSIDTLSAKFLALPSSNTTLYSPPENLEDNVQLALMLFNMPKFNTVDELQEWLNKEYVVR